MNTGKSIGAGTRLLLGALVASIAAGGGYWLGRQGATAGSSAVADALKTTAATVPRKLLYYRNPMGLPDTSPTPKKDPMGMDYIAVYAGEEGGDGENGAAQAVPGQIRISSEKIQKLGVRSEAVQLRLLAQTVRAAGRVEPDEGRVYAISPKFEGYVERLHVNVTGQAVAKGQPLFEAYSPELVSAQREYAIAAQAVDKVGEAGGQAQEGMAQLAEASLARLRNWDVAETQIRALAQSGEARRTLTFRSPVSGIVTEKKALQGMRFMPGEALYQVADLSSVWVVAEVAEQDIGLVKPGTEARVRINAYPDKRYAGKVAYVYPTLNAQTRTVAVRIELPNPGLLLKPAMFAQVELTPQPLQRATASGTQAAAVVSVPVSAIIDSGTRQVALVDLGEGRFEPRQLRLGARSDSHVEVIDGVREGERVVVAANFLLDAESNLKAALGGYAPPAPAASGKNAAPSAAVGTSHHAEGTVEEVDAQAGTVSLAHGPVASLKWPAMTMEFALANASLLSALKPGARVAVDFVERAPGEWVIIAVRPATRDAAALPSATHDGH